MIDASSYIAQVVPLGLTEVEAEGIIEEAGFSDAGQHFEWAPGPPVAPPIDYYSAYHRYEGWSLFIWREYHIFLGFRSQTLVWSAAYIETSGL